MMTMMITGGLECVWYNIYYCNYSYLYTGRTNRLIQQEEMHLKLERIFYSIDQSVSLSASPPHSVALLNPSPQCRLGHFKHSRCLTLSHALFTRLHRLLHRVARLHFGASPVAQLALLH